jgi:hypothetical protein
LHFFLPLLVSVAGSAMPGYRLVRRSVDQGQGHFRRARSSRAVAVPWRLISRT